MAGTYERIEMRQTSVWMLSERRLDHFGAIRRRAPAPALGGGD